MKKTLIAVTLLKKSTAFQSQTTTPQCTVRTVISVKKTIQVQSPKTTAIFPLRMNWWTCFSYLIQELFWGIYIKYINPILWNRKSRACLALRNLVISFQLIKPPLFIAIFLSTKVGVVLKRFKSASANSRCFLALHFMFSSTGFGVNNISQQPMLLKLPGLHLSEISQSNLSR